MNTTTKFKIGDRVVLHSNGLTINWRYSNTVAKIDAIDIIDIIDIDKIYYSVIFWDDIRGIIHTDFIKEVLKPIKCPDYLKI